MMEGSLCLIDGRVRRNVLHCSKLMCWKHAGEPSEQIAVEASYPSSMIVIEDQFAGQALSGTLGLVAVGSARVQS
jgi:hypothetical protein